MEDSRRKIGDTIPVNIATEEDPRILKIGAQCSEVEKQRFLDLSREFVMSLPGLMLICVVLIQA